MRARVCKMSSEKRICLLVTKDNRVRMEGRTCCSEMHREIENVQAYKQTLCTKPWIAFFSSFFPNFKQLWCVEHSDVGRNIQTFLYLSCRFYRSYLLKRTWLFWYRYNDFFSMLLVHSQEQFTLVNSRRCYRLLSFCFYSERRSRCHHLSFSWHSISASWSSRYIVTLYEE